MDQRFDNSQQSRPEPDTQPVASPESPVDQKKRRNDGALLPISSEAQQSESEHLFSHPLSGEAPSSSKLERPDAAPLVADQKMAALRSSRPSGPVKIPRRVRFSPEPLQDQEKPPLTEQQSFVDQETRPLSALTRATPDVSRPAEPAQLPGSAGKELALEDQETRAQQTVHVSPLVQPSQHRSLPVQKDQSVQGDATEDQETRSLTIVRVSTPPRNPQGRNIASPLALSEREAAVADQETRSMTALPGSASLAPTSVEESVSPGLLRRIIRAGWTRLQEPQPEGLLTRGLQAVHVEAHLGLVPVLALVNALGLFLISASYYLSVWEYGYLLVESCFLGGLICMFVPNTMRLLSRAPSRWERICLLCVLGMVFYFVRFIQNLQGFTSFNDFLHWRTIIDILQTGHLFSVNAMLPVSPYYPGLELVTDAISTTTGLNAFYSGEIVTATAHFLMILALYLFYEYITNSSRMASVALMVYMANPHFLFFDTIFSYETLALPLAILMVYILARYGDADKNHHRVIGTAWLVLAAVVITHHMTSYVFDGLLLLWAGVSFFRPVSQRMRVYLTAIAISGILLSLAYAFFLPGNPVWTYLSEYFGSAFTQLEQIISGSGSARPLFTSAVQAPPIWDKLLITGSVALVTFSLPFGLLSLRSLHRRNALAVTLGLASLIYPLTQAFRFTSFGTEITDRAAAFLFLPIAYILTILITHFWPTRQLTRRTIALISSAILVIFLGNSIVATSPNLTGIPGPYLVVADARSVEPEGINAALWSLHYLGAGNRVATDRINQMLMSTYGDQRILTRLNDNIDVSPLFYSMTFDQDDIALLQAGQIRYLVVDTRISTALPLEDTYFENDVPHSVISRDALTKFSSIAQMNRLFDSGDIVIYDAGAFLTGEGP